MMTTRRCMRSPQAIWQTFTSASIAHEASIPSFLVPALARQPQAAHFSTSVKRCSKIGKAPLSLPPEVTLRILEPPAPRRDGGISRTQPLSTVEVKGPLGEMKMTIPSYMSIAVDEEARTRTLSISDTEDKQQKAMWGAYTISSIH